MFETPVSMGRPAQSSRSDRRARPDARSKDRASALAQYSGGLEIAWSHAREPLDFDDVIEGSVTGLDSHGAWRAEASLVWGSILYLRMAIPRASTPSLRPVGGRVRAGGSAWVRGMLCVAVGRRACPSRRLRRRSTSWSSSVSDSMSSARVLSRLKQTDGRFRTGNVNLLKLGGPTSASPEPPGVRLAARIATHSESLRWISTRRSRMLAVCSTASASVA